MSYKFSPEVKLCEAILSGDVDAAQKQLEFMGLAQGRWKEHIIRAKRVTHPAPPLPALSKADPVMPCDRQHSAQQVAA